MKLSNFCSRSARAKARLIGVFIASLTISAFANPPAYETITSMPLLIIGSSYENGSTAVDSNLIGPLGGAAVGTGSYRSLGDALIKDVMPGVGQFVINEAAVGSTTFDRFSCFDSFCLDGGKMSGYQTQFNRALLRVALRDPSNPTTIIGYNARYLFIGIPNDCLHSDSFGIPQAHTAPCSTVQINESADRIIGVANQAIALGITPIIPILPKFRDLNLALVQQSLGFSWVVDEAQYNEIRDIFRARFKNELPNALVTDVWANFKHRGDGIHPSTRTTERAVRKIKLLIDSHIYGY